MPCAVVYSSDEIFRTTIKRITRSIGYGWTSIQIVFTTGLTVDRFLSQSTNSREMVKSLVVVASFPISRTLSILMTVTTISTVSYVSFFTCALTFCFILPSDQRILTSQISIQILLWFCSVDMKPMSNYSYSGLFAIYMYFKFLILQSYFLSTHLGLDGFYSEC